MGCSNPHPHGQIWSLSAIPTIPAQELRSLKKYALSSKSLSEAPRRADGSHRLPYSFTLSQWFISQENHACYVNMHMLN
jgi:hypothetical protein